MIKNAKVFLLSNNSNHYYMLKRHGYKDILWFKNSLDALDYVKKHPDIFDYLDAAFMSDIFFEGKSSLRVRDQIYKKIMEINIPFVEIEEEKYFLTTNRTLRANLSEDDVFCILYSYKYDKPSDKKKREKFFASKNNKDLKVLFIGNSLFFPFVESYFISHEFGEIKCVDASDVVVSNFVDELSKYDIVITESLNVLDYLNKLSDEKCKKDEFMYLANFNLSCLNETNSANIMFADTVTRQLIRRSVSTAKDINKLYQYILDCVLEGYKAVNDKVRVDNIRTFDEIMDEYSLYRDQYRAETDEIRRKLQVVSDLEYMISKFMLFCMRRSDVRTIDGVRFERLENGKSVAFVHDDLILARITFDNDSRNSISPYYKEFKLEVANSKGYLMNLGYRSIYDDRDYKLDYAHPVVRNDDFIKVEGIYKRTKSVTDKKKNKRLKLK